MMKLASDIFNISIYFNIYANIIMIYNNDRTSNEEFNIKISYLTKNQVTLYLNYGKR